MKNLFLVFFLFILSSIVLAEFKTGTDILKNGKKGSTADKILNLGNDFKIKKTDGQKAVFSNDNGSTWKTIGSGSGAGEGINLLSNAGFEDGISTDYTYTAGTFTQATAALIDGKSLVFAPLAQNDFFETDLATLTPGVIGRACEARVFYTGADENLTAQVIDANGLVLGEQILSSHSVASYESVFFYCPSQAAIDGDALKGQLKLKVYNATATIAAPGTFDDNYMGPLIGLVETVLPDVLSARIASDGSIISKSSDWILDTSNPSTGEYHITFRPSLLSQTPTCTASAGVVITANTHVVDCVPFLDKVVVTIQNNGAASGVRENNSFSLFIQKQGADAKQSVQVYKSIPKVTQNINDFVFNVDSAGAVSLENADIINGNCTGSNPKSCTFNLGVFDSAPVCTCSNLGGSVSTEKSCVVSLSSTETLNIGTTSNNAPSLENASVRCTRSTDYKFLVEAPIVIPNAVFYGPYDLNLSGVNWTTTKARANFYTVNGAWNICFQIDGSTSSATRANYQISIAGIEFDSVPQFSGGPTGTMSKGLQQGTASTLYSYHASTTTDIYRFGGCSELKQKPTMYAP